MLPEHYQFHTLTSIDSTNLYAMHQIHEGLAENGTAYYAIEQTNGKGQRGRTWYSQPNKSIHLSIVLDCTKVSTSQYFRLSAAVAVGARNYLANLTEKPVQIKWPNDLYIADRKAGGILIENVISNNVWRWAVVGIGININQNSFPENLQRAISARIITKQVYDCESEAKNLCFYIDQSFQHLLNGGWKSIFEEYNNHLFAKNTIRKIRKNNPVIPCLIKSVNEQGYLIAGELNQYSFEHGSVEWIL